MYRIQMDHLPLWHYPGKAAGMGIGQGTRDIIECIFYFYSPSCPWLEQMLER